MAEVLGNENEHFSLLAEFVRALVDGQNGRLLLDKYWEEVEQVSPAEVMALFDLLLNEGVPIEKVKAYSGKIVNVFYKGLSEYAWERPGEGHFLFYMMQENAGVKEVLDRVRILLKSQGEKYRPWADKLLSEMEELKAYELHYRKKENILFPYIEKTFPQYRCLQIMWSYHDDFRRLLDQLMNLLLGEKDDHLLNQLMGELFFTVLPILFREENILYPVLLRTAPPGSWKDMLMQAAEVGWCYTPGPKLLEAQVENMGQALKSGRIDMGSGSLSPEQFMLLLNHLPIDITFVDENDEVCYFSEGRDRIFPRSRAIIGRKVQNCHPPESVQIVNRIVESFRSGKKDEAEFRIWLGQRFIGISYFAVRDANGNYRGTVELSQDLTAIKAASGEKRLLDWDEEPAS